MRCTHLSLSNGWQPHHSQQETGNDAQMNLTPVFTQMGAENEPDPSSLEISYGSICPTSY
ncbi:hypothetical protein XAC3608_70002 [Xanthomonas citri pv. citri]|nr:hypothetical protein XAC3608_70002 [Xanthomonas citri pv. citri]